MNQVLTEPPAPPLRSNAAISVPRRRLGYDPALAAFLCAQSAACYASDPPGEIIDCDSTETRALCLRASTEGFSNLKYGISNSLILAFRGTANLCNWLSDLDCLLTGYPTVDYGGCRVHLGFWRAWLSVRDRVAAFLAERYTPNTTVYFTGHSLGGALAMLAAHWFHDQFDAIPTTYTFGQPRVGNFHFAANYDLALRPFTFRIVHGDDLVPRVPWLLGGYRHAGRELFYIADTSHASHRSYLSDPSFLDRLPWDLRNALRELRHGKLALLADHHVN